MVEASRNGEISRVRELIRKGVNVDAYENEGKNIDLFLNISLHANNLKNFALYWIIIVEQCLSILL